MAICGLWEPSPGPGTVKRQFRMRPGPGEGVETPRGQRCEQEITTSRAWEAVLFKWLTPFRRPPEGVRACNDRGRYLMAFGPSRHRAWAVVQRPLECSLGSRGRPLGGLLVQVLKPLGGRFGAFWGLFWASWGPLGGLLGLLGTLLGAPGPLGRRTRIFDSRSPSRAPLGAILGPSWAVLGECSHGKPNRKLRVIKR